MGARAERLVFGAPSDLVSATQGSVAATVVRAAVPLLDAHGAPLVIDVALAWCPPLWAEAVCVLDAVLWSGLRASP